MPSLLLFRINGVQVSYQHHCVSTFSGTPQELVVSKERILRRDKLLCEAKLSKLRRHELGIAQHTSPIDREAIHCHQPLEKSQGVREVLLDYRS